MAREAKKDPSELSVEEKLKALYQLQTMLSEIDKIKTLRGELPLEVQDLEDEVTGLSTRIEKIKGEIEELKSNVTTKRIEIESAKASVDKYKAQQDNVRNNSLYFERNSFFSSMVKNGSFSINNPLFMVRRKRTSRKTYCKIIFLFAINIVVCKDFYTFVKPDYI